jgi:hypothetical protein
MLKYSNLICGMCFCIQLQNINKYSGQSNSKKDMEYQAPDDHSRYCRSLVLVAGSIFFTSGKSKLNVDTERITVSEIKKGPFQEFIPVNGVVMPLTTIYLDAVEGGRVEEKYVEDGANLKKGDPIIKLANTDLGAKPG